jgi:spermidine synthase
VLAGALVLSAAVEAACAPPGMSVLAEKQSPFGRVAVVEEEGIRYLRSGRQIYSGWEPANPDRLVYPYTQLIGAAITAWPGAADDRDGTVLIVGLGGCSLCRHILKHYPRLQVEAVELDPVVHEFARQYFALGPRVTVHIEEGRQYLERTGRRFDIIVLDAFSETYVPPQLMTREFLDLAGSRLAEGGVLIANTWETSRLAHHESRTYFAAFGPFHELRHPATPSGNRIILAGRTPLPDLPALKQRMDGVARRKAIVEFDVGEIITRMTLVTRVPPGPVLTDANVRQVTGE